MRKDILSIIADEKDVTNVIVLTHNIDFVFLQNMVLPALRKCGHPSLTVFADAQCAAETYQFQHMMLDTIGRRYRVVPIAMRPGFRFHPKAILLSGPNKGTLLVGSGNLTFGGWRENAEVWCRFDTDTDTTAPFAAFRDYLYSVTSLASMRSDPELEVGEAFDGKTRAWAVEMASPAVLVGKPGNDAAVFDQMKAMIEDRKINQAYICTPYFDASGHAINALHQAFDCPVMVAVPQKRSNMSQRCADSLGKEISIKAMTFQHKDINDAFRSAFIHAKWYAFETDDEVVAFAGSANCSQAALTIPGALGNAELMAMISLSKEAFETNFKQELTFLDTLPEFISDSDAEIPPEQAGSYIRCDAARNDQSVLQVAYHASDDVAISSVFLNSRKSDFSLSGNGIVLVRDMDQNDRHVEIEGTCPSGTIVSNRLWIDHESELKTTARKRSVIDAVRSKMKAETWDIGTWNDILSLFYRNLEYLPEATSTKRGAQKEGKDESNRSKQYTSHDVFRADYGTADFRLALNRESARGKDRITSLRQLLIRWFGLKGEAEEPIEPGNDPEGDVDGEDVVDRPESVPIKSRPKPPEKDKNIAEKERKRARDTVDKLVQGMTSENYAMQRPGGQLSIDLQFASILLKAGLREKWITPKEFFSATHRIWAGFFFHAPGKAPDGWIAYRCEHDDDPDKFKTDFAGPKLAAALGMWFLSVPEQLESLEHARFYLAQLLSVARFPWIWNQDINAVGEAMHELLVNSAEKLDDRFFDNIEKRWLKMMEEGGALQQFERALAGQTPKVLEGKISQVTIQQGEVLWQGSAGFCIAKDNIQRKSKENVEVLSIKSDETKKFRADFVIPARALLKNFLPANDTQAQSILDKVFSKIALSSRRR